MPHYEYRCDECGHEFEAFQRMTDDRLKECPKCGGAVQRLMSPGSGLIFKGSGFYITDYKNSAQSGPGEGSASKSGESSDSKPAESAKPAAESKPAPSASGGAKDTGGSSSSTPKKSS